METARRILSKEYWSARSDDFKLAEAVLLDDFDKADEMVKRVGATGVAQKMAYNLISVKSQEAKRLSEDEQ